MIRTTRCLVRQSCRSCKAIGPKDYLAERELRSEFVTKIPFFGGARALHFLEVILNKRDFLLSTAMMTIAFATTSVSVNAQTSSSWPNLLEAKDIAEEGFIYGLPLVMY